MSIEKRLTIVARYNEDISWANNLPGDVVIYNKGESFPYEIPRTDVKNTGREAETYVRAIIDFYDQLSTFDSVCFLQGDPFAHCSDVMDTLSNHKFLYFNNKNINYQPIIYLADESFQIFCPRDAFIFGTHTNIIDIFWEKIDKKSYKHITEQKISFQKENIKFDMYDMLYLLEIMKIPYKDKAVSWAYGAQYLVDTELILCKSKDWWINFYNFMIYTIDVLESESFPYIMERLWPTIFYHGYKNDR
jgi:hypothetical protein